MHLFKGKIKYEYMCNVKYIYSQDIISSFFCIVPKAVTVIRVAIDGIG